MKTFICEFWLGVDRDRVLARKTIPLMFEDIEELRSKINYRAAVKGADGTELPTIPPPLLIISREVPTKGQQDLKLMIP